MSKKGHLAALCIGVPDYKLMLTTWKVGLKGRYADLGVMIFYTASLIISFFSIADNFGSILPEIAVTYS